MKSSRLKISESEVSRVVEMAWEDRTPFEVIKATFGLSEAETIKLMRREMKANSFRLWRKRVTGRVTKHRKLRGFDVGRGYCPTQYKR
ncbi:MAG: TIGR03643 family protein [Pseudomonadota bacterium]|nr:TIGR03643 family protein [Pseudomonadota bacterium]